jgi:signal transduction histidine kinase
MPDPKRVFKKYYRAPGAYSKTGSGLGLHIAQSIVRKLGGWMRYQPVGNQIRFEVWIPV